jgi:hypothetical protein
VAHLRAHRAAPSGVPHHCGGVSISLGDAKSSLGDAKSSLGDAKSSLGDAKSWLGDANISRRLGGGGIERRAGDGVEKRSSRVHLRQARERARVTEKVTRLACLPVRPIASGAVPGSH